MDKTYAFQTKTFSERFFGHLKTVCKHKYYVAQGCFKCGLYKQGILHDLSKFTPTEFSVGVKYFDGHKSPNAVQRHFNDGCSTSWLHHKGRNRHHYEYWIDYAYIKDKNVYGNRMPMRYLIEMACDRRAACITYQGPDYSPASPWKHLQFAKEMVIMHPDTKAVLEKCLLVMKEEGEEASFRYMRGLLAKTKGSDYTAEMFGLEREFEPLKW